MPSTGNLRLGRGTVQETVARALLFVAAAGTSKSIRSALAGRGYADEIHDRFWEVLHQVCQFRGAADLGGLGKDAVRQVGEVDKDTYRLGRAALKTTFQEQHDFVFEGIEAAPGIGAVVNMRMFLDRVDELESGKDRKATRKADHAGLAKMAARGITPEERQCLRGLLVLAQRALNSGAGEVEPSEPAAYQELRAMVEEWSEVARVVITRRADLIQLGLVRRKKPAKKVQHEGVIIAPPMQVGPAAAPRGLPSPSVPAPASKPLPPN